MVQEMWKQVSIRSATSFLLLAPTQSDSKKEQPERKARRECEPPHSPSKGFVEDAAEMVKRCIDREDI